MTRTPAPALSPTEAAIVARFDAAPVPPEVVGENIEAVVDALYGVRWPDGEPLLHMARTHARRLAAAALAALPPSPAEEAVKRVEAIVEEMEDDESIGIPPHVPLLIAALRAALDPT